MEPTETDFKKRLEFFKNLEKQGGGKGSFSKPTSDASPSNSKDSLNSRFHRNTLPAKALVPKAEELKVLVIGPSGAGKSSLINLLYAWSKIDLKLEQLPNLEKLLIPTQYFEGQSTTEQNVENISESQTTTPNLYTFECDKLKSDRRVIIQILDTPGLRDTRGIQQDDRNVDAIIDEVISKTPDLNAILVMLNGTQARIDSSVNYVLTKLHNMIPDSWRSSIFYLLSNVGFAANMQLNFEHNKDNVFQYDNPIFRVSKDVLRKPTPEIKKVYENSAKKMKEMLLKMTGCSVKPTLDFAKIKEGRDLLKQKLAEYSDLATTFHHLKINLNEILSHSNTLGLSEIQQKLTVILKQKYTKSVPSEEYNTLCLACKISCHENCQCLSAKNCSSFVEEGSCSVCSHGYNLHVRIKRKFQTNTRKLQGSDDLKNLEGEEQVKTFITKFIDKFDNDLRHCYLDVLQSSLSLRQLCSCFDYFKELATSLQLLDEQIYLAQRPRGSKYTSLVETREKLKKIHDTLLQTQHNDYLREVTRTQADIEAYVAKQEENHESIQIEENLEKKEGQEIQYTKPLGAQTSTVTGGVEEEVKQEISDQLETNQAQETEIARKFQEAKDHEKTELTEQPQEGIIFEQSPDQKEENPPENLENLEQPAQIEEVQPMPEEGSEAKKVSESDVGVEDKLQEVELVEEKEAVAGEDKSAESDHLESASNEQRQHLNSEEAAEKIIQEEEQKLEANQEAQNVESENAHETEESTQNSWQQYVDFLLNNDAKITHCAFIDKETGEVLGSKDTKLTKYESEGKLIDEKRIVLEIFDQRKEIYNQFLGHVYINGMDYVVVKENEDNAFSLRCLGGGGAKIVRTSRLIIYAHFSSGFLDVPNAADNLAIYMRQFDW